MGEEDWPRIQLADWSTVAPLSHRTVTLIRRWCWACDHLGDRHYADGGVCQSLPY